LNLKVQGTDKHVVDVIRAIIAFKSILVLQQLRLVVVVGKGVTDTCPKYWKNIHEGKSTSK
jgi:hypothetical protein